MKSKQFVSVTATIMGMSLEWGARGVRDVRRYGKPTHDFETGRTLSCRNDKCNAKCNALRTVSVRYNMEIGWGISDVTMATTTRASAMLMPKLRRPAHAIASRWMRSAQQCMRAISGALPPSTRFPLARCHVELPLSRLGSGLLATGAMNGSGLVYVSPADDRQPGQ